MTAAVVRFALFVSAVRGHLVTRFGTDRPGLQSWIGAHRVPGRPDEIVWDDETIVPLSEEEARLYRREYERAFAHGALRKRTEAEYRAQLAEREKAERDAAAAPPNPVPET